MLPFPVPPVLPVSSFPVPPVSLFPVLPVSPHYSQCPPLFPVSPHYSQCSQCPPPVFPVSPPSIPSVPPIIPSVPPFPLFPVPPVSPSPAPLPPLPNAPAVSFWGGGGVSPDFGGVLRFWGCPQILGSPPSPCVPRRLCHPSAMSFTDSTDSGSDRPVSVLWGCELSAARSCCTFRAPEDWRCEQQLVLRTVCLGEAARDEFHVLEVLPEDGENRTPVPLATLRPSVLPSTSLAGVELTPPVTFRLRAGSGPLFVSGQHVSLMDLSSEEDEDDDEEEEAAEETPKKPPKGSGAPRGGAAKKRKREKEEELNSLAPEGPPPAKGRGAGRGRKAAPKK
uniref:Nucleophosmin/nucleoplasmin 2 n=1 Tax=Taeniopygia guttata TaxID=59729 RepID=A0A674GCE9_TAEGU